MGKNTPSSHGHSANSTEENIRAAVLRQLPVPSAEVCERLREAVARAATRDPESLETLRRCVADFTIELRDGGTTPESVLISLKAVVTVAILPPIARNHPDWSGYILREQMSAWCIAEYFGERSARSAS